MSRNFGIPQRDEHGESDVSEDQPNIEDLTPDRIKTLVEMSDRYRVGSNFVKVCIGIGSVLMIIATFCAMLATAFGIPVTHLFFHSGAGIK